MGPEVILDLQLALTLCHREPLPSLQPSHTETRRLSYRLAHRLESTHTEQQEPVVMSAAVFLPYRGAVDREAIQRRLPPGHGRAAELLTRHGRHQSPDKWKAGVGEFRWTLPREESEQSRLPPW